MGCPATCLRLTIVITDFILWLLGIAVLAVGSFLKLSNYVQYTLDPTTSRLLEYETDSDLQFSHFSWLLIIVGIVLIFTAILGACSVNNGQVLLIIYSLLVLGSMCCQTVLFLLYSGHLGKEGETGSLYKIPGYVDESLLAVFKSALNLDKSDIADGYDVSPIGTTIIALQNRMNCCGYHNACDFCSIQGEENVYTKELIGKSYINQHIKKCDEVSNRCKNICPKNDELESSFKTGCKQAFEEAFESRKLLVEISVMSWLILQFLVSFFAVFLCCVNRKDYKEKQEFKNDHIRYQNEQYGYNYKTGASLTFDRRPPSHTQSQNMSHLSHHTPNHHHNTNAHNTMSHNISSHHQQLALEQAHELQQNQSLLHGTNGRGGTLATNGHSTMNVGTSSRTDNEMLSYHRNETKREAVGLNTLEGTMGRSYGIEDYGQGTLPSMPRGNFNLAAGSSSEAQNENYGTAPTAVPRSPRY